MTMSMRDYQPGELTDCWPNQPHPNRPSSMGALAVRLNADALLRQSLRYLGAAAQDTHPLFGLCHANYARILLEELVRAGAVSVTAYLIAATKLQDKWSMLILRRFPIQELPLVQALIKEPCLSG